MTLPLPAADGPAGWDCHVHVFDAAAPVRPGHYRPAQHPLEAIESLAARHGFGRLVLVQPSVYGSDNRVMLQALRACGGRHRGVAVVDPDVGDAELDELHAAGVRGVRFNRVSPAGHAGDAGAALRALAPRLHRRGWHVQWYVQPEQLPELVAWQAETGLVFVLDHLAGLHAQLPLDAPPWAAARALAAGGAWVKLSGWYRLQAREPYAGLHAVLRQLAGLFGPRVLWGSDWPHTSFPPGQLPSYASTLHPLQVVLDARTRHAVCVESPALLYGC